MITMKSSEITMRGHQDGNNMQSKKISELNMERRYHKRIYLHMKARIIWDDKTYDGYVEDVSESGIGSFVASSHKINNTLAPDDIIELNLQISPDKTMNLNCKIIWIKKGTFSGDTIGLGMQIIDTPSEYSAWINKLLLSSH